MTGTEPRGNVIYLQEVRGNLAIANESGGNTQRSSAAHRPHGYDIATARWNERSEGSGTR